MKPNDPVLSSVFNKQAPLPTTVAAANFRRLWVGRAIEEADRPHSIATAQFELRLAA